MEAAGDILAQMQEVLRSLRQRSENLERAIMNRDLTAVCAAELARRPLQAALSGARDALKGAARPTADDAQQMKRVRALMTQEAQTGQLLEFFKADIASARLSSRSWIRNSLANLPALCETPSASALKGVFAGRTAVLVSAGPSLERNLHLLHQARDRAVVIAVNRAVAMMAAHDLRADLTVVTDSLDHVIVEHLSRASPERTPTLVGRPSLDPRFFTVPCERRFLFSDHSPHELFLAELAGATLPTFPGASVAHVGLQIAAYTGCDRVIVIGQDLALLDGELYGSSDPDRAMGDRDHGEMVRVAGYGGGEVVTTRTLALYLRSFVHLIDQLKESIEVLNATEGGAAIAGARPVPLAEALAELSGEPLDVQAILAAAHRGASSPSRVKLQAGIAAARRHLATLLEECEAPGKLDDLAAARAPVSDLLDGPLMARWAEALGPLYEGPRAPSDEEVLEATAQATGAAAREIADLLDAY